MGFIMFLLSLFVIPVSVFIFVYSRSKSVFPNRDIVSHVQLAGGLAIFSIFPIMAVFHLTGWVTFN